jgi:hypothetical protein
VLKRQAVCCGLRFSSSETEQNLVFRGYRAALRQPNFVPQLQEMRRFLEQSIWLIDGSFNKGLVKALIQNIIDALEDSL